MRCESCKRIIDLELTPEETYDMVQDLIDHQVVMVCMECTQEQELVLSAPELR